MNKNKNTKIFTYKVNDNIEFLDRSISNWRFGKVVAIDETKNAFKVSSGLEIFWTIPNTRGTTPYLETV